MAPGHYNPQSKNFGGLHTGTGKYQNGGPYANNGYQKKRISHALFKEGSKVDYVGSNKRLLEALGGDKRATLGTVVSNDRSVHKNPKSVIRVLFSNGKIAYIHKSSLSLLVENDRFNVSYKNKEREMKRERRRKKRFRTKYPEEAAKIEAEEQKKAAERAEERAAKLAELER